MIITEQDQQTFAKWFKQAGVIPADEATVPALLEYFSSYGYPIDFARLNVAVQELGTKLKWEKIPTPANDAIIADWLANDCPKELLSETGKGLAPFNIDAIGKYITPHLGATFTKSVLNEAVRVLTEQRKLAYYGQPQPASPAPTKTKTAKEISDAFSGQGAKTQTGRVNHAHTDEAQPLSAQDAQQATMKLFAMMTAEGHTAFVKAQNQKLRAMASEGKSAQDMFSVMRSDTAEYSAQIAIKKFVESAGSGSIGAIQATRTRFANIVKEGYKAGWKSSDIAKLLQRESDGERDSFIGNGGD